MATDLEVLQSIADAQQQFDLNAPLTPDELASLGMLVDRAKDKSEPNEITVPILQDLDEMNDGPVTDVVASVMSADSYNARYTRYLECQALAALVAFDEGWKSFEKLALLAYVNERRRENAEYRGDDPNRAFSLRIRQQAAEDFIRFIRAVIHDAVNTPKPVLNQK